MEGTESLLMVNSLPFPLPYSRRKFNSRTTACMSMNQLLISLQGSIRWKSPQMDSGASRWWRGINLKVLRLQRPEICLRQMSLHSAECVGLKNKTVCFYFMWGSTSFGDEASLPVAEWISYVNVWHPAMSHFYLVEGTEMVIVFRDRDLEQNPAFADKAFQEASKDKRGKKCIGGSFKKDLVHTYLPRLGWIFLFRL